MRGFYRNRTQTAEQTPFVPGNLESPNVQDAVAEVFDNNFSWGTIPLGRTIKITENQQMLSFQEITIKDNGEIDLYGEVIVL
jgi:hypothetical protein